jgi:hypothetical protein
VVQVAAGDTEAQARDELARLARAEPELMREAVTRVARAVVGGRAYWRSLVGGFASRADAVGFCRALTARSRACFVRN